MSFTLHPRLKADTLHVGDLPLCTVLLSKEKVGPWLILVPKIEDLMEIHHLPHEQQIQLITESSAIAAILENTFQPDKINVGALGNLVPQLHIHHIARFKTDIAWPGPIWGNTDGEARNEKEQQSLVNKLQQKLSSINGFQAV